MLDLPDNGHSGQSTTDGSQAFSMPSAADGLFHLKHRPVTVCFTGHRHISNAKTSALSVRLDLVLDRLYALGYRHFISGGALGFDVLAAERVVMLRDRHPDVRLLLALPCSTQSSKWRAADCQRYEQMLYQADQTHVLSPDYFEGCMQTRNRFMVNHSSFCVCYLEHAKGGTVSTVSYAVQKNLPLLNAAMPEQCAAFIDGK